MDVYTIFLHPFARCMNSQLRLRTLCHYTDPSDLPAQPVHHRHAVLARSADDHDNGARATMGVRRSSLPRLLRRDVRQHVHRDVHRDVDEHRSLRRRMVAGRLQQVSITPCNTFTQGYICQIFTGGSEFQLATSDYSGHGGCQIGTVE